MKACIHTWEIKNMVFGAVNTKTTAEDGDEEQ